jgi:hypothetical protein
MNKIKNWIGSAFNKKPGNKTLKVTGNILLLVFCAIVLAVSIRGNAGNPTPQELNTKAWKDNGPLELSPERGRFALLYAVAEQKSFSFTPDLARFATPDVGYIDGKYVSLFAPAVSFLAIPGYLLGKYFGISQVGSFAIIALFALLNVFLIRAIAIKLGAHPLAATIGALTFLFATPAFAYAVTLYQHHISTFIILLSIFLLMRYKSVWSLLVIWMLCAFSVTVDYPNFFMMLPIGMTALAKTFLMEKKEGKITLRIPLLRVVAITSMIIPMLFFMWFNNMSYGNPLQLSGTVDRSVQVNKNGSPVLESEQVKARLKAAHKTEAKPEKNALGFFNSRLIQNGFYIYFLSPDRGIIMYAPVMLFGIAGLVFALKRRTKYAALLIAVIGFNIVLYSMWDDPYGGWAFGSRYLIPSYALLAAFLGLLLTWFSRYWFFAFFFFTVLGYSIGINTLGAITSNMNPPMVEAIALEQTSHTPQPYTFVRNINVLNENISKSYVFQTFAKSHISAQIYFTYLALFITVIMTAMLIRLQLIKRGENYAN